jgi:pyruvate-formate lyase-activating enzyme
MIPTSTNTEMRSGFLPDRIVHLHPTRLCNLACLHCYSESGPKEKAALELESLTNALPLLKAEGYNLISLSGGEPLTYGPLVPLIDYAHTIGFRVTMITNGLFAPKRIDDVVSRLDGVAISFDGLAETHNRLRGRSDAFERSSAALARLADNGQRVAAAISLTRDAIPELPDLAEHLVSLGAKALQVRPVALAGRARTMTGSSSYTATDQARLYLVVLALQEELAGQVRVQCDLAPARSLWQQRDAYAALLATCAQKSTNDRTGTQLTDASAGSPIADSPFREPLLADLVNPLIITETGTLKPIAYDFDSRFDVAPIEALSHETLAGYKQHNLPDFQMLIGNALARLEGRAGLVDWFDYCTRLSEEEMYQPIACTNAQAGHSNQSHQQKVSPSMN